jgi:hypothetical protein
LYFFLQKRHVAPCLGDRGHFWNFLKRPYIFEILIFLNIKMKIKKAKILSTTTTISRPTQTPLVYDYKAHCLIDKKGPLFNWKLIKTPPVTYRNFVFFLLPPSSKTLVIISNTSQNCYYCFLTREFCHHQHIVKYKNIIRSEYHLVDWECCALKIRNSKGILILIVISIEPWIKFNMRAISGISSFLQPKHIEEPPSPLLLPPLDLGRAC